MRAIRKLLSRLLPAKRVAIDRRDLDPGELVRVFQRSGLSRGRARAAKAALFAYLYQLERDGAGSVGSHCMPKK